ncbi:MAG: serine hydrolase, partial [Bacteroidota bacterium]
MKEFLRVTIITLVILGLIILFMPAYLRTALIHQTPDIDDYQIFHNRVVHVAQPVPWEFHENYG